MKFFTTEGPVNSQKHYCLPPLKRFDLEEILRLISDEKYFLLHAPRQTGKTTCLMALTAYLNKEGKYRALYANIETAQAARENVGEGIAAVLQAISEQVRRQLKDEQIDCLAQKILAEKLADVYQRAAHAVQANDNGYL